MSVEYFTTFSTRKDLMLRISIIIVIIIAIRNDGITLWWHYIVLYSIDWMRI